MQFYCLGCHTWKEHEKEGIAFDPEPKEAWVVSGLPGGWCYPCEKKRIKRMNQLK